MPEGGKLGNAVPPRSYRGSASAKTACPVLSVLLTVRQAVNDGRNQEDDTMPLMTASSITPVETAARWLGARPVGSVEHTLPTLMKRFDLSAPEALLAIRRANVLRAEAKAQARALTLQRTWR
jgi:hypothetical protein